MPKVKIIETCQYKAQDGTVKVATKNAVIEVEKTVFLELIAAGKAVQSVDQTKASKV